MNRSLNEKRYKLKILNQTDASTHEQDNSTILSRVIENKRGKP